MGVIALPLDFVPNAGQLTSAWLVGVDFRHNRSFSFGTHGAEWSLEVDDGEVEHTPEGTTSTEVNLKVRWDAVQNAPFEEPFNLSITVAGEFAWSGEYEFDEEYRRGWTKFNGLYLLWPYVRSYVSMVTGAAGLPPFYLPTLVVPRVGAERGGDTVEFEVSPPPEAAG